MPLDRYEQVATRDGEKKNEKAGTENADGWQALLLFRRNFENNGRKRDIVEKNLKTNEQCKKSEGFDAGRKTANAVCSAPSRAKEPKMKNQRLRKY